MPGEFRAGFAGSAQTACVHSECLNWCVLANLLWGEISCWHPPTVEQELKESIQRRQGSQSDADTSVDIDAVGTWIDSPVRPEFDQKQTH